MNKVEKTFKSLLLLIAATICGFVVGALSGGVAGIIISLIIQPRIDFISFSFAMFGGAITGLMWGSSIGLLVGLTYLFPRARRCYWLIALPGGIVGYLCGQDLIMAPFINRSMAIWIPVFISVLWGVVCALLVAVVLRHVTAEGNFSA